jgi:hypothetical protein
MPSAYGTRLRLRLFLEGIEVPVIAVNVRSAPNSPTAASIQIPPLPEGTRFLPRTLVHLFFLDLYEQESPLVRKVEVGTPDKRSPTAHEKALEARSATDPDTSEGTQSSTQGLGSIDNGRYKLLFGGEVLGFQWSKNASQRSLVLQCMDWSNYWDYAYQWGNTGIFGPGIKAVFSGGATNLFTDFLSTKGSVLTRIVSSGKCASFPNLKGLAAGIIRLIEAIGGFYFPRPLSGDEKQTAKKFAGQNIFFSVAELRLHITHMIAAFEDDPTSSKILRRQGYAGLFNRMLGGQGGQTSIRQSISALTGVMFHETYGQPCPYYKPGTGGTLQGSSITTNIAGDPTLKAIVGNVQQVIQIVKDVKTGSVAPEDASTALGDRRKQLVQDRNVQQEALATGKRLLTQALTDGRASNIPGSASGKLSQAIALIGKAAVARGSINTQSDDSEYIDLRNDLDGITELLQAITNASVSRKKVLRGDPARLNQHILRPDIWFGAPPRCNVLFPEDYESLSYSRAFLEEPTRFMLKTNDEFFGEDFLFDKFYFAPQAGSLKKDHARLQDMLKNDLLDHELFTGILPVFEKMGEFNVFAANSGTQKNTSKVGFAQRSANFLYFKHRFASRQMQIRGKFNPYIAVGFPGLVIDKYVDQVTIQTYNDLIQRENERRSVSSSDTLTPSQVLGTNFLANFTEVSHSISQSEARGTTEINCSYARQPDESVEFLGSIPDKQTVRKRQDKDALRATDVAAISAPKLGSQGPMGGKIVNVTDVTNLYSRQSGSSKPLPLFGRTSRAEGGQLKAPRVQVGVPTTAAAAASPDIELLTGGAQVPVVFRAFRVDEEVPRYSKEDVDLPAEEFLRPGWYGDVWTTAKIGTVYEDFFGIGSIADAQQVRDSSIGSLGVQNDDQADAAAEAGQAQAADDPSRFAPALVALDQNSSIQQAVDFLLLTYSFAKISGADIDQFVRSYTWRPIASMVDMFGTSDLSFSPDGGSVEAGFEGFHSRAFGPYDDLFGLTGPDIDDILGIKRGSTTAQRADTRRRKYEAVQQYVSALLFSRGLL